MQLKKAQSLHAQQQKRGKSCKHPSVEKEYYLGADTGDRVCSSCGAVVYTSSQWEAYKAAGPQLHDL